jgi:DNA-binding MarR family transcriptional regulator
MNTPTITPDPSGLITVTAAYTPSSHVHDIESVYTRHYWLPQIGPLSYLTLVFLNAWMPDTDTSYTVGYDELAHQLGATPARLTRTIGRLEQFRLAHLDPTEPDTVRIVRRVPTLNSRQLARLAERCPTLAAAHDHILATAA